MASAAAAITHATGNFYSVGQENEVFDKNHELPPTYNQSTQQQQQAPTRMPMPMLPPIRLNQNNNAQNNPPNPAQNADGQAQWGDFNSLNDKNVRIRFIRKVYLIILAQLIFTFGICAIFVFVEPVKVFAKSSAGFGLYMVSYILFFILIIVFSFCQCCGTGLRKTPWNYLLLIAITITMTFMLSMISAYHSVQAVLIAIGITVVIVLGVTLVSMQTKYDFTRCIFVAVCLSFAMFGFGIAMALCSINTTKFPYLQAVYGGVGAALMSLFLAIDTQMLMGNKKYAFSEEDYINAALQLYLDICYIFIYILSIFGGGGNK